MGTAIYNVLHRYNLAKIREALHTFRGSGTEADQKPHKATQEAAFMYE